jgi:hypothetical protein
MGKCLRKCNTLVVKSSFFPFIHFYFYLFYYIKFNICHQNAKMEVNGSIGRLTQIKNAYFVTHMWLLQVELWSFLMELQYMS